MDATLNDMETKDGAALVEMYRALQEADSREATSYASYSIKLFSDGSGSLRYPGLSHEEEAVVTDWNCIADAAPAIRRATGG